MRFFLILTLSFMFFAQVSAREAGTTRLKDPVNSKGFKNALYYLFSYKAYEKVYPFSDNQLKYDPNADGWKIYPHLGEKIKARISRMDNNLYRVEFQDMPEGLKSFHLIFETDGSWHLPAKIPSGTGKVLNENYEFEIPAGITSFAAQTGEDYQKTAQKLEHALKRFLERVPDAPEGENNFFIAPFDDAIFPGNEEFKIYIYWREGGAMLIIAPQKPKEDPSKWGAPDFKVQKLNDSENSIAIRPGLSKDEAETAKAKARFFMRIFDSNPKIANCVRDGYMLTIVKKIPNSKDQDKAVSKDKEGSEEGGHDGPPPKGGGHGGGQRDK